MATLGVVHRAKASSFHPKIMVLAVLIVYAICIHSVTCQDLQTSEDQSYLAGDDLMAVESQVSEKQDRLGKYLFKFAWPKVHNDNIMQEVSHVHSRVLPPPPATRNGAMVKGSKPTKQTFQKRTFAPPEG